MDNDKTAPSSAGLAPLVLPAGWTVAERFVIQELAGTGGMGFVYRAMDRLSGEVVALKMLQVGARPDAALRFDREAQVLEGLRHPAIVSHVAHGVSAEGQPFLAMEWIEGEDLANRLRREPLSLQESMALLRRAAEGLAQAHRQGVVHRDIKPSNLFLRESRAADVVLVDFGLARNAGPSDEAVTLAGSLVGTPGYMAPEQASSQTDIPPAADIFSLGCVLYECLAGQPPFSAAHLSAVLAKILFAEPVPLTVLRPELPLGPRALVERMLIKDLSRRPANADHLLRLLAELDAPPRPGWDSLASAPSGVAGAEQKLFSVLLASPPSRKRVSHEEGPDMGSRDSLRTALSNSGAQVALLADGSLVATVLPERGTATDQAAVAARSALSLKEQWPEATVVLVTGVGVLNERLPVGSAMDRAGVLLRHVGPVHGSHPVVLDEVTAGLLGSGFQLSRVEQGVYLLRGEQLGLDESRPLLGKPTPCVGREQELALLERAFQDSAEDSTARAVLVTAPAGTGKSRLRHEFLRRLERDAPRTQVLWGRGDPMITGGSFGLLGQVFRRWCGVVEGEPLEVHRERLRERLSRHLPEAKAEGAVDFLGELCAIPMGDDEDDLLLRAARGDPRLMSNQVERALVTFFEAECAQHPVLLVLEDLHWSDELTVRRVDVLLRELAEQPFGVLALARPEVKELFAFPWTRRFQELPLLGLSRKAGGRLVREVLGPQVEERVVRWAVEMADGNALFLEELIRVAAEGRGMEAPETVLAVLQARLMRMASGARRVLLAASIFGRDFWPEGVAELLGAEIPREALEEHLRALVEQEVIGTSSEGGSPMESRHRFRHALLQEAAYGLLSDSYRPEGHRLAGAWLERMAGVDPRVLATHHQRGGQPERAVHFYALAAERLFALYDMPGTLRCVEEALSCGVEGAQSARLRALQAVVAFWSDDLPGTLALSTAVLDELEPGSQLWCWLVGGRLVAGVYLGTGAAEPAARWSARLWQIQPAAEAVDAHHWALACLGLSLVFSGARWELEEWLVRMREVATEGMARPWTRYLDGYFHHLFEPRPWRAFQLAEEGARLFREFGMERDALIVQTCAGVFLGAAGDRVGAMARLSEVMATGRQLGAHLVVGSAQVYWRVLLACSPEREHRREAHALAREDMGSEQPAFRAGLAHAVLAKTWEDARTLGEAEAHARRACELLTSFQADVVFARGVLSAVLLARGNAVEAREVALHGVRELEESRSQGVYAVSMYLALAEACFHLEDREQAESALRRAVACVRARAEDFPEPAPRERFLREIPENVRVLERARECWGETGPERAS
ncbi:MAG: protein kinase [Cystobacter sp.]